MVAHEQRGVHLGPALQFCSVQRGAETTLKLFRGRPAIAREVRNVTR